MKHITWLVALAGLLAACAGGGKQKNYTPVNLYYDPLEMDASYVQLREDLSPENTYPHFASYPDDRAKLGVRGNVALVAYLNDKEHPFAAFGFDEAGKLAYLNRLSIVGGEYYMLEFLYDDNGRLAGTYDQRTYDREKLCAYDESGRLSRFSRHADVWNYAYRPDGSLESVRLAGKKDEYSMLRLFTRMDFNEAGQLTYSEAVATSNPFLERLRTPSFCTYSYAGNLLSRKVERILVGSRESRDTVDCTTLYFYNGKGDLARLEYSGAFVAADDYIRRGTFVVHFDYKYDERGNWTAMHVILPEGYAEIPCFQGYLGVLAARSGEKREAVIRRDIRYHAFTAEESAKLKAKEKAKQFAVQQEEERQAAERAEKRKNAPRYTALQGHGLYGEVKSVSTERMTIYFDEYGNLLAKAFPDGTADEYIYESPTRYTIRNGIGPFNITCESNLRKEEDEKGIEPSTEYEFDDQGRVIRHRYALGMSYEIETFTYQGTEKFPSSRQVGGADETGRWQTTDKYTYLETDTQGNWTKRKVQSTTQTIEYACEEGEEDKVSTTAEPEIIETRAIVYY